MPLLLECAQTVLRRPAGMALLGTVTQGRRASLTRRLFLCPISARVGAPGFSATGTPLMSQLEGEQQKRHSLVPGPRQKADSGFQPRWGQTLELPATERPLPDNFSQLGDKLQLKERDRVLGRWCEEPTLKTGASGMGHRSPKPRATSTEEQRTSPSPCPSEANLFEHES